MGPDRGPVASRVPLAQRYFQQGMMLTWGFNPAEAARSFDAASAADPGCALCYWGLAWTLGPNINADMAADDAVRVRDALARARALAGARPRRDRALIDALSVRHPAAGDPTAIDEEAYAVRMRALARQYPRDADAATLAAEALLNLHPYDWWDRNGSARPWTGEIRALLARALALAPGHPGANHYWIHLMESSPHPDDGARKRGPAAALVPGSGHLLHMPAHIYMRMGRYARRSRPTSGRSPPTSATSSRSTRKRAYRVGYVAHNQHFLWAAAAMEGRSALALAAARAAFPSACGPGRGDRSTGILQQYYVLPLYALVRFGRWREILEDTLPPDVDEPYALAIWHYARGTAFARTGRIVEARRELDALERLAADPGLQRARIKNINPAAALVRIAVLTLGADIAAADGRPDDAVARLVEAVAIEDGARVRRAASLARADPACARRRVARRRARRGRRARLSRGPSALSGKRLVPRRSRRSAASAGPSRRGAGHRAPLRAAWRNADIPLTGSRF